MRLSGGTPALRPVISRCTSTAQRNASTHTAELDEQPVAGGLDESTAVLGDFWINELAAQRLEALERAFLVRPHQPRIADDISGQDRRQPPLDPLLIPGIHAGDRTPVSPFIIAPSAQTGEGQP